MKTWSSLIFLSSVFVSGIGLAQADNIPHDFQGKWINIGNPAERDPYCKANIEQLNPASAKNLYIIQIGANETKHAHFDEHGHLVRIQHDNFRFKTNTDAQIRGLTRRAYQSEHLSRVYKAYSFRYELADQKLTTPAANGQAFYRCY